MSKSQKGTGVSKWFLEKKKNNNNKQTTPQAFKPLAVFTSRKLCSLRRHGLFFSWSYFQRYFEVLLSSALTSTGISRSALLRGVEMKGVRCMLLATRVRGQREGGHPPSTQPMYLQRCDTTQPTFPHLHLGHNVGKEGFF